MSASSTYPIALPAAVWQHPQQSPSAQLVRVRDDPSGQQRLLDLEPPQEEDNHHQLPLTFTS